MPPKPSQLSSIHTSSGTQPLSVSKIRAIECKGLAQGLPLMQRAGQCAAEFARININPCQRVWLLVGPGNNGGDALTAGRFLVQAGVSVTAVMPVSPSAQAADAQDALAQWHSIGQTTIKALPERLDHAAPDLIVDGLFGIGLNKALGDPWRAIIEKVNALGVPVLALDIPSGLVADTGQCLGEPIRARWTLAFIAPSHALYDQGTQKYVGESHVCTLGLEV